MKKIAPFVRIVFLALFLVLVFMKGNALMIWLALFATSLLLPLLIGKRVYCTLMCPMNTVMTWMKPKKKASNTKNKPAPRWLKTGWFAWLALGITILTFIITRKGLNRMLPIMVVWIIVSIIVMRFYHQDVFHDLICPYGTLQRTLSKVSLFSKEGKEKASDYKGFTESVLRQ